MTEKRFHWDWKTGRMKDTYSSFQATKDMRLIEQSINDACGSYEKQIAKLEKENEQLKSLIKALKKSNTDYVNQIKKAYDEDLSVKELADNCGIETKGD